MTLVGMQLMGVELMDMAVLGMSDEKDTGESEEMPLDTLKRSRELQVEPHEEPEDDISDESCREEGNILL